MKKLRYHLVDVFTDHAFGGNQLAVFTDARGLSSEMMRTIAGELNLTEAAFVLPPEDGRNDYCVRIFTPTVELPMAEGSTIGAAFVLAAEGMIGSSDAVATINLEEGVGAVPVRIEWRRDAPAHIQISLPLPVFGPRFTDVGVMAEILSIDERAILGTELPMEVVSCGAPFLFVPVQRIHDLHNIRFCRDVWERAQQDFEAPHVYVFTRETEFAGSTVHSRMFAPALGSSEDTATGGASGALGCYLARHRSLPVDADGAVEFISEQGIEMDRPSFIKIRIEQKEGVISAVNISGQCHLMGEGFLYV